MDYSLLKNKIYLTLLAYYNNKEMPSFINLGKQVGVSRQTASTKTKELITNGLIVLDNEDVLTVKNSLNIDIEKLKQYLDTTIDFNAVDLKKWLFSSDENNIAKIARELKMSRSSMYLDKHSVVYAI